MALPKHRLALPLLLGLSACTTTAPMPGTPEFVAAQVSRAYDCGLRVDRGRVVSQLSRDERSRFMAANAAFAVKSYKAPRACDGAERVRVQREVAALARR
ncbi:hypothetical protein IP69_04865 [Bosea sp. AAP35]|uniref:hypothetical protein n=1 Tax=Bosea sp. AAP35 TaxID=1523417 RepID=UPI0006BA0296|nr:hypothetical protein [Bosea sp. AAP35]KPF71819.1 hypothetical protein IP69_04865 [Bosea sp. AAP35]